MAVMITILFLIVRVYACHDENQCFIEAFYLAENRALLNHVFQSKTVSSPVICGRDCSMDPQCASFNFQTNNVCVLNNASRAHSPGDFLEVQGSAYYDDNVDTLSLSLPITTSYSSCRELYQAGYRSNGIYTIYPTGLPDGVNVFCDMETGGGGWIVFQRRQDGSVDFYRNWTEYQSGFGDLPSEFWLGNDILRDLTGSGQWQLRVDMEDWLSNTAWAIYGEFAVTGDKYTIQVGSYDAQSTAGDSMSRHNGHPFTAKDQDNDALVGNCAESYKGAWLFLDCFVADLNDEYYQRSRVTSGLGIQWTSWKGYMYSLKKCSMKIRQVV
ncbi:ryncolin-1-like [Asterias rubens]|uniref:ryncolin-1-like n=1 Tax=Asterias rubens TaxID=7604 RepID=UPI001454FD1C|nr:ryncolin-1-like [Asterias rubens]